MNTNENPNNLPRRQKPLLIIVLLITSAILLYDIVYNILYALDIMVSNESFPFFF